MSKEDRVFHEVLTPAKALKVFDQGLLHSLNDGIHEDIQKLDRDNGIGIFLKDNLQEATFGTISIATVCKWFLNPEANIKDVQYMKYHVYKNTIPDAVLDDINLINSESENPTWIHEPNQE